MICHAAHEAHSYTATTTESALVPEHDTSTSRLHVACSTVHTIWAAVLGQAFQPAPQTRQLASRLLLAALYGKLSSPPPQTQLPGSVWEVLALSS
jgi:hypothetical protein